jgi:4-amino-4-deoxy-L-arabinose transferase-like glycosyltransferase
MLPLTRWRLLQTGPRLARNVDQEDTRLAHNNRPTDTLFKGPIASTAALAAIVILAAFLRFWNLEATEFKYDEARVCNLAAHFVDTGTPPLRGMGSSTGIDNPPLAIYLMSVPVLFSRDPLLVTGFVTLLNVIAVWGCYRFGRRYWGTTVGLLAALLLAVSPWAIFYSRKVWAQNLLLPFVLLHMSLLYAWLVDDRRWALSGAIVTLAALTQIHFAALALAPVLVVSILASLIQRLRQRRAAPLWAPLAVGIAGAMLAYVPYLVADAQGGWDNVRALLDTARAPAQTQWEAVRYALLNVGGREIHALAGPERYQDYLAGIPDLSYWPDRLQEALVIASALYLAWRCWQVRKESRRLARYGVLLMWLVLPVLFFLRSPSPVYPPYLIPLYPAPYLALAITVHELVQAVGTRLGHKRLLHVLVALPLVALVAWQSYLSLSIHAFVDQHHTPGGMGTPVRILRQVVRTLERQAETWDNRQAVMVCPGDNPRWDECPAVFGFMTSRSLDVRFVDGRASLLFPQSKADTPLVLAPGQSRTAGELPRYVAPLPGEDVALREDVDRYRFYRLPAGVWPAGDAPVGASPAPEGQTEGAPVRLANGVELLGYEWSEPPAPGQTARLALYWRVGSLPADPPAQGYSFANHLLGNDDRRAGQSDGPGYRVDLWQPGDTLVSWFDFDLPADAPPPPYRLRTGMYVYTPPDQYLAIPVVDAQGQPVADAVEWPAVE